MRLSILLVTCGLLLQAVAQETIPSTPKPSVSDSPHMGLGVGLDHGGIGLRVDVPLNHYTALVAGGGYALVGIGWNAGLLLRFIPDKKIGVYGTAMYGYNAVIKFKGGSQYDAMYYGLSVGAGAEFRQLHTTNFWKVAVFLPLRSPEFNDDFDTLKNKGYFEDKQGPWPVLISVGYHFAV